VISIGVIPACVFSTAAISAGVISTDVRDSFCVLFVMRHFP
jgi:hypothetical protein